MPTNRLPERPYLDQPTCRCCGNFIHIGCGYVCSDCAEDYRAEAADDFGAWDAKDDVDWDDPGPL